MRQHEESDSESYSRDGSAAALPHGVLHQRGGAAPGAGTAVGKAAPSRVLEEEREKANSLDELTEDNIFKTSYSEWWWSMPPNVQRWSYRRVKEERTDVALLCSQLQRLLLTAVAALADSCAALVLQTENKVFSRAVRVTIGKRKTWVVRVCAAFL